MVQVAWIKHVTKDETLVLNAKNNLVQYLLKDTDGDNVQIICEQYTI